MVGHFLDFAFDGSFENLETSGAHVPAGFRG